MSTPEPIRPLDAAPAARRHNTNKGRKFPPEIYRVEDIAAVLAACTPLAAGPTAQLSAHRLRAIVVILYRTGMRISELLALEESDLHREDRAIVVRRGKGGKRRVVVIDDWGWAELQSWLSVRVTLPAGPLICVVRGHSKGEPMVAADVRRQFRCVQQRAVLRRRFAPHQLRHTFSVEFHRETKDLLALQRQLGHANPSITSIYLRGLDDLEVLGPIRQRRPPMMVIPSRQ